MSKKGQQQFACSACGESLDASAFSKTQLAKNNDRKCKECTEGAAPPAKAKEVPITKGKAGGEAPKGKGAEAPKGKGGEAPKGKGAEAPKGKGGASFECSSCHFSKGKNEFSANQLLKNDFRRCKTCVESGPAGDAAPPSKGGKGQEKGGKKGKKEVEYECSSCGDELPASEFSKNQLNKGDDRKCKDCVDSFSGGGGGRGMFGDDEDDFDDLEDAPTLEDLPPKLQKLVGSLLSMAPDEMMDKLEDMVESGKLSEDQLQQVMMVLAGMAEDDGEFGEGEDEDEGEDDYENLSADEDDIIESLGLEVNVGVLHDFEKEKQLLASISSDMKRSERARIINKYLTAKLERIMALDPRKYRNIFQLVDHEEVSDSDEAEHTQRLAKEKASQAGALAHGEAPIDLELLAKANAIVYKEEGGVKTNDLLRVCIKRRDDFCQLILWSRGRRFDGILKADPAIVVAANAGDLPLIRAILAAGGNVDSCSSWAHKGMFYDRETALVVAARLGNKPLVEFLLKCGADPNHTCYDKEKFLEEIKPKKDDEGDAEAKKKKAEEEEAKKKKEPENMYSFEPPVFVFVKTEPDEDTPTIVATRHGHAEIADLLAKAAKK